MQQRKIRVLVVDDSLVFREALARGISFDPMLEVLPPASDPYDAWFKLKTYAPHVLTCDMEMPGMNGLEFMQKVMKEAPRPMIAVSSRVDLATQAKEAGAFSFMRKPTNPTKADVQSFIIELSRQIRMAAQQFNQQQERQAKTQASPVEIIAIGASTGGTEALHSVFRTLPPNLPGIVIVQHIPPMFSTMFAQRLDQVGSLRVREAKTGDWVEPGTALIAPGDRHLTVVKLGNRYKVECIEGEKVNGHCPSVDVLFNSVAQKAGQRAVGVLLTGMGTDGARGLLHMRESGARTFGQDEASSIVYGMPKAAFDIGAVEKQLPLNRVSHTLVSLCR